MESSAFVDSSTLDVIVPQYPDLNLRDLVLSTRPTNDGGSGFPGEFHIEEINASALFSSIAQRTTLHFGIVNAWVSTWPVVLTHS